MPDDVNKPQPAHPSPLASRRQFILGGMAAVGAAWAGTALQSVLFPKATAAAVKPVSFPLAELPVGGVRPVSYGATSALVMRTAESIRCFSLVCTHLGCLLNWDDRDGRFKCPCHGSGFDLAGVNREGPAPRPLERLRVTVEDGRVIVDGRRRFRGERGEWGHSESMVRLEPSAES